MFNPIHRRGEGINWGLLSYTVVMFALATGFTATNLSVVFISLFETGFAQGEVLGSQMLAGPPILRALRITPSLMFLSISWLADGLLVSSLFDAGFAYRASNTATPPLAVSLLRDLCPELLDHRLTIRHVHRLFRCAFRVIDKSVAVLRANIVIVAMGIVAVYQSLMHNIRVTLYSHLVLPYFSVSLSLNIILTLMIAVRLVMHSKDIRAAMGAPAGINGMCKAIVAILVESSALYALSSLLVIGPWVAASDAVEISLPVLAETQARDFPRSRPSDRFSNISTNRTGHRSTAHHSTDCKQERVDEQHSQFWRYRRIRS